MIRGALMIQGTTSDAGKSTLVAALGRYLARRGVSVAPFKPQNMTLSTSLTTDGGEIARVTAMQAAACRVTPHTDMNPILLKPRSDRGSDVIVRGHLQRHMAARDYQQFKPQALDAAVAAWEALRRRHDVVLVEGAGSPAEINLRAGDLANMGFAERVDCPVWLVADIDRGGVFAHLTGTLALLSASEQARVSGLVINRFRGDPALLQSGVDWLQQYSGKPVTGVLPYLHGLVLEPEDSLGHCPTPTTEQAVRVVVPSLPRMAQHADLEPLRRHPQVALTLLRHADAWPGADLVLLPPSADPLGDARWLADAGWRPQLLRHLRYGGVLLGLGQGFALLGEQLSDSHGRTEAGLGLLALRSRLQTPQPQPAAAYWGGQAVAATDFGDVQCQGAALARPLLAGTSGAAAGAISDDGQVFGSALHGVLGQPAVLAQLLSRCGVAAQRVDHTARQETSLERLADWIDEHLDTAALMRTLRG